MALIDRSNATRAPFVERLASVGTNWQAWTAPHWCTQAVIKPSADVWYAFVCDITGATEPADGNAASGTTHKGTVAADAAYAVLLRNPLDRPVNVGLIGNRTIYVAAKAGTADVEIEWSAA
jgi:hypothetical protein